MTHLGGPHWKCEHCERYVTADCSCCAPPPCTCEQAVTELRARKLAAINAVDAAIKRG